MDVDMSQFRSSFTVVDVPTSSVEVLPPSQYRRMIRFGSGSNTDRVYFSCQSPAVAGRGMPAGAGVIPEQLNYDEVGDLVCRGWFAISTLGTQSVEIWTSGIEDLINETIV